MGEFIPERLPDAATYFESEGLTFQGRSKWRSTQCVFHGGSDSLRVNCESGAWVCMACGEKGGDVLSYAMRAHDLGFVEAARRFDAYVDSPSARPLRTKPATLAPRDAMEVMVAELLIVFVVVSDIVRGIVPCDSDWQRFIQGVGRIEALAAEFRT